MSWLDRTPHRTRAQFDAEVLPLLQGLYGTALRLTRNERDAEDLVQETALRAFRFFHRYEPGTNARAWLFRILHNVFVNRYHRATRDRELAEQLAVEPVRSRGTDPEEQLTRGLLSAEVREALDRLPADFRTAIVLCDLEGFSYREIADIMECPIGTVMSRLHRGRRLLQDALRGSAHAFGIDTGGGDARGGGDGAEAADERVGKVLPLRREP